MRTKGSCFIGMLATLAWVTGCEDPGKKPVVELTAEVTDATEESRLHYRRAAFNSHAAAVEENRKEFVAASEQKLAELDEKIADLAKRSETHNDDAKAKAGQMLEALKGQRAQLKQDLEEFKSAGGKGGKEALAALDTALNELEKAFDNARTTFERDKN
jgi:hypothetical protein